MWALGKHSFKEDLPNAVLVADGIKAHVFELNGMEVSHDSVKYPLRMLTAMQKIEGHKFKDGLMADLKNVVLFIDGASVTDANSCQSYCHLLG